ncbi:MAG TPA: heme biosynthesis HemY N-terminal domain-containing protein [Pseudolabrys sp.]|nr:heme biosynthesis HemY N-terminal domain-containing protein [Pseudolabrys sp.]
MIRVVTFLVAVAVLAAGFVWVADRPGDVTIIWIGYRLETSVMVAALALVALVVVLMALWSIVRAILRSPDQVSLLFRHRRAVKGYLAISRGLIAIGAGDLDGARKSAEEAARLSPGDPLALLLMAQSAQMRGDHSGAERAFREMTRRENTKLLGLRGLYIEAQRRNDALAARLAAEEAGKTARAPAWAGQAVLDYRCAAADWAGALDALERIKPTLERPNYRRKRAVLLTALALGDSDHDTMRSAVLEAVKLAPDLVPAAALAGRRLAEAGELRKARRILERAWAANPHPDLAEAYADLRLGDSARERLGRVQKLTDLAPGNIEGAIAVARIALDARDFAAARAALAPFLETPTQRIATLMAEIEEAEHGDEGRVREWMARAMRASGDPMWTADGTVSEHWQPISPNGRLDGYIWKVPLAEIGVVRPVIEAALPPQVTDLVAVVAAAEEPAAPQTEPEAPRKAQKPAAKSAAKDKPVEPVIPLVHVPDDPGPDSALEADPMPEPTAPPLAPWERLKQLFR